MATIGRHCIKTTFAPAPVGPYSQAVVINETMYLAGQIGLDAKSGQMVPGGITAQTEQALKNLGFVLAAAGANFNNVVKVTVLLSDINNFDLMNSVYTKYFTSHYPARSAFQVAALPKEALVEIEAIAVLGQIVDLPGGATQTTETTE